MKQHQKNFLSKHGHDEHLHSLLDDPSHGDAQKSRDSKEGWEEA